MNKQSILVIDDEAQIQKLLEIVLDSHGYAVNQALNGKEGIVKAANHPPDLILLDLGLPDMNGLQVLRELRKWYHKGIIILSVRNEESIVVEALDAGASDYLCKPFRNAELVARMRVALRNNIPETESIISAGNIEIDILLRQVKRSGIPVKLTVTEYELLLLLSTNVGKVLTHGFILQRIWGPGFIDQTQYLRVFIGNLRKKLEEDPNKPIHFITESGVGYRFMIPL